MKHSWRCFGCPDLGVVWFFELSGFFWIRDISHVSIPPRSIGTYYNALITCNAMLRDGFFKQVGILYRIWIRNECCQLGLNPKGIMCPQPPQSPRHQPLEVEPCSLLLHLGLPLPFCRILTLAASSPDPLIHSAELQGHSYWQLASSRERRG